MNKGGEMDGSGGEDGEGVQYVTYCAIWLQLLMFGLDTRGELPWEAKHLTKFFVCKACQEGKKYGHVVWMIGLSSPNH